MTGLTFCELEQIGHHNREKEKLPLDNVREALALLSRDDSSAHAGFEPLPEIRHGWGHTTLSNSCWKEIDAQGYVEGVPKWGYVSRHEFVLSEKGRRQLRLWQKEEEETAKQLLIPGIHGWSAVWRFRGIRSVPREGGQYEHGLVFSNPLDECFIVFLGRGAVEPYVFDYPSASFSFPFTYLGHFIERDGAWEHIGYVFSIGNGKCRIYYPGTNQSEECSEDRIPTQLRK